MNTRSPEPFARVPISIFNDPEIETAEIAVYASLASFPPGTHLTIDAIVERSRVGKTRTKEAIQRLERLGHLVVNRNFRNGNRNAGNSYTFPAFDRSFGDSSKGSDRSFGDSLTGRLASFLPYKDREEDRDNPTLSALGGVSTSKPEKTGSQEESIEDRFREAATAENVTWRPKREGKALNDLAAAYSGRSEELAEIVDLFMDLRENPPASNAGFWKARPPLPSALLAVLGQVETLAASRTPKRETMIEPELCPDCGQELVRGICRNRECPGNTADAVPDVWTFALPGLR